MAKKHGARQQKRAAKQKAKRQAKRTELARRSSKDPTIRLQHTESWPIVEAHITKGFWQDGLGHLVLARREPEGGIAVAWFLVDVLCLGVKDAFWRTLSAEEYRETLKDMDKKVGLAPIKPPCLVKIIHEAIAFAESFGFAAHPEYRHAAMLLEGIEPAECQEEFEFGEEGMPVYFQGQSETPAEVRAIVARVQEVGGRFLVRSPAFASGDLDDIDDEDDYDEDDYEEEELGLIEEPGGGWKWMEPPKKP